MSLLLEETLFEPQNKPTKNQNQTQTAINQKSIFQFFVDRFSHELSHHQFTYKSLKIQQNDQILLIMHHKIFKTKDILFKIIFNRKKFCFDIETDLLEKQNYFVVKSRSFKLQICNQLKKELFNKFLTHNFVINMDSGTIKLNYSKLLVLEQEYQQLKKTKFSNRGSFIFRYITNIISKAYQSFSGLLQLLQKQSQSTFPADQNTIKNNQQKKFEYLVEKPMVLKTVIPSFFGNQELRRFQSMQYQQHRLQIQLLKLKSVLNYEYYDVFQSPYFGIEKNMLQEDFLKVEASELEMYQKQIQPERLKTTVNSDQNKYIFNRIKIFNGQNLKLKKIKSTAFSDIYLCLLEFKQIGSEKSAKIQKLRKQFFKDSIEEVSSVIKKTVVLKMQKKQKPYKNIHQVEILTKIKGSSTSLFPKFYYSNDQKFKNIIFSEHLKFPTMNEFLQDHKYCLSLKTKLRIALMTAQALRVLKNYNIVHLDVKLQNIFIYKDYFIKMIDFGESYNQQICQKDLFKPGFTFPFCSPQVFIKNYNFNQKQDVYSFGVLLHIILFQVSPFTINKTNGVNILKQKQHLKYWFFAAQNTQNQGSNFVIVSLLKLINCCLDPDQIRRPYIDWICLILKTCQNYLNNY